MKKYKKINITTTHKIKIDRSFLQKLLIIQVNDLQAQLFTTSPHPL